MTLAATFLARRTWWCSQRGSNDYSAFVQSDRRCVGRLARSADAFANSCPGIVALSNFPRVKNQVRGCETASFYLVRITGVPRPRLSVRAALPLFTPISRYPLEPS